MAGLEGGGQANTVPAALHVLGKPAPPAKRAILHQVEFTLQTLLQLFSNAQAAASILGQSEAWCTALMGLLRLGTPLVQRLVMQLLRSSATKFVLVPQCMAGAISTTWPSATVRHWEQLGSHSSDAPSLPRHGHALSSFEALRQSAAATSKETDHALVLGWLLDCIATPQLPAAGVVPLSFGTRAPGPRPIGSHVVSHGAVTAGEEATGAAVPLATTTDAFDIGSAVPWSGHAAQVLASEAVALARCLAVQPQADRPKKEKQLASAWNGALSSLVDACLSSRTSLRDGSGRDVSNGPFSIIHATRVLGSLSLLGSFNEPLRTGGRVAVLEDTGLANPAPGHDHEAHADGHGDAAPQHSGEHHDVPGRSMSTAILSGLDPVDNHSSIVASASQPVPPRLGTVVHYQPSDAVVGVVLDGDATRPGGPIAVSAHRLIPVPIVGPPARLAALTVPRLKALALLLAPHDSKDGRGQSGDGAASQLQARIRSAAAAALAVMLQACNDGEDIASPGEDGPQASPSDAVSDLLQSPEGEQVLAGLWAMALQPVTSYQDVTAGQPAFLSPHAIRPKLRVLDRLAYERRAAIAAGQVERAGAAAAAGVEASNLASPARGPRGDSTSPSTPLYPFLLPSGSATSTSAGSSRSPSGRASPAAQGQASPVAGCRSLLGAGPEVPSDWTAPTSSAFGFPQSTGPSPARPMAFASSYAAPVVTGIAAGVHGSVVRDSSAAVNRRSPLARVSSSPSLRPRAAPPTPLPVMGSDASADRPVMTVSKTRGRGPTVPIPMTPLSSLGATGMPARHLLHRADSDTGANGTLATPPPLRIMRSDSSSSVTDLDGHGTAAAPIPVPDHPVPPPTHGPVDFTDATHNAVQAAAGNGAAGARAGVESIAGAVAVDGVPVGEEAVRALATATHVRPSIARAVLQWLSPNGRVPSSTAARALSQETKAAYAQAYHSAREYLAVFGKGYPDASTDAEQDATDQSVASLPAPLLLPELLVASQAGMKVAKDAADVLEAEAEDSSKDGEESMGTRLDLAQVVIAAAQQPPYSLAEARLQAAEYRAGQADEGVSGHADGQETTVPTALDVLQQGHAVLRLRPHRALPGQEGKPSSFRKDRTHDKDKDSSKDEDFLLPDSELVCMQGGAASAKSSTTATASSTLEQSASSSSPQDVAMGLFGDAATRARTMKRLAQAGSSGHGGRHPHKGILLPHAPLTLAAQPLSTLIRQATPAPAGHSAVLSSSISSSSSSSSSASDDTDRDAVLALASPRGISSLISIHLAELGSLMQARGCRRVTYKIVNRGGELAMGLGLAPRGYTTDKYCGTNNDAYGWLHDGRTGTAGRWDDMGQRRGYEKGDTVTVVWNQALGRVVWLRNGERTGAIVADIPEASRSVSLYPSVTLANTGDVVDIVECSWYEEGKEHGKDKKAHGAKEGRHGRHGHHSALSAFCFESSGSHTHKKIRVEDGPGGPATRVVSTHSTDQGMTATAVEAVPLATAWAGYDHGSHAPAAQEVPALLAHQCLTALIDGHSLGTVVAALTRVGTNGKATASVVQAWEQLEANVIKEHLTKVSSAVAQGRHARTRKVWLDSLRPSEVTGATGSGSRARPKEADVLMAVEKTGRRKSVDATPSRTAAPSSATGSPAGTPTALRRRLSRVQATGSPAGSRVGGGTPQSEVAWLDHGVTASPRARARAVAMAAAVGLAGEHPEATGNCASVGTPQLGATPYKEPRIRTASGKVPSNGFLLLIRPGPAAVDVNQGDLLEVGRASLRLPLDTIQGLSLQSFTAHLGLTDDMGTVLARACCPTQEAAGVAVAAEEQQAMPTAGPATSTADATAVPAAVAHPAGHRPRPHLPPLQISVDPILTPSPGAGLPSITSAGPGTPLARPSQAQPPEAPPASMEEWSRSEPTLSVIRIPGTGSGTITIGEAAPQTQIAVEPAGTGTAAPARQIAIDVVDVPSRVPSAISTESGTVVVSLPAAGTAAGPAQAPAAAAPSTAEAPVPVLSLPPLDGSDTSGCGVSFELWGQYGDGQDGMRLLWTSGSILEARQLVVCFAGIAGATAVEIRMILKAHRRSALGMELAHGGSSSTNEDTARTLQRVLANGVCGVVHNGSFTGLPSTVLAQAVAWPSTLAEAVPIGHPVLIASPEEHHDIMHGSVLIGPDTHGLPMGMLASVSYDTGMATVRMVDLESGEARDEVVAAQHVYPVEAVHGVSVAALDEDDESEAGDAEDDEQPGSTTRHVGGRRSSSMSSSSSTVFGAHARRSPSSASASSSLRNGGSTGADVAGLVAEASAAAGQLAIISARTALVALLSAAAKRPESTDLTATQPGTRALDPTKVLPLLRLVAASEGSLRLSVNPTATGRHSAASTASLQLSGASTDKSLSWALAALDGPSLPALLSSIRSLVLAQMASGRHAGQAQDTAVSMLTSLQRECLYHLQPPGAPAAVQEGKADGKAEEHVGPILGGPVSVIRPPAPLPHHGQFTGRVHVPGARFLQLSFDAQACMLQASDGDVLQLYSDARMRETDKLAEFSGPPVPLRKAPSSFYGRGPFEDEAHGCAGGVQALVPGSDSARPWPLQPLRCAGDTVYWRLLLGVGLPVATMRRKARQLARAKEQQGVPGVTQVSSAAAGQCQAEASSEATVVPVPAVSMRKLSAGSPSFVPGVGMVPLSEVQLPELSLGGASTGGATAASTTAAPTTIASFAPFGSTAGSGSGRFTFGSSWPAASVLVAALAPAPAPAASAPAPAPTPEPSPSVVRTFPTVPITASSASSSRLVKKDEPAEEPTLASLFSNDGDEDDDFEPEKPVGRRALRRHAVKTDQPLISGTQPPQTSPPASSLGDLGMAHGLASHYADPTADDTSVIDKDDEEDDMDDEEVEEADLAHWDQLLTGVKDGQASRGFVMYVQPAPGLWVDEASVLAQASADTMAGQATVTTPATPHLGWAMWLLPLVLHLEAQAHQTAKDTQDVESTAAATDGTRAAVEPSLLPHIAGLCCQRAIGGRPGAMPVPRRMALARCALDIVSSGLVGGLKPKEAQSLRMACSPQLLLTCVSQIIKKAQARHGSSSSGHSDVASVATAALHSDVNAGLRMLLELQLAVQEATAGRVPHASQAVLQPLPDTQAALPFVGSDGEGVGRDEGGSASSIKSRQLWYDTLASSFDDRTLAGGDTGSTTAADGPSAVLVKPLTDHGRLYSSLRQLDMISRLLLYTHGDSASSGHETVSTAPSLDLQPEEVRLLALAWAEACGTRKVIETPHMLAPDMGWDEGSGPLNGSDDGSPGRASWHGTWSIPGATQYSLVFHPRCATAADKDGRGVQMLVIRGTSQPGAGPLSKVNSSSALSLPFTPRSPLPPPGLALSASTPITGPLEAIDRPSASPASPAIPTAPRHVGTASVSTASRLLGVGSGRSPFGPAGPASVSSAGRLALGSTAPRPLAALSFAGNREDPLAMVGMLRYLQGSAVRGTVSGWTGGGGEGMPLPRLFPRWSSSTDLTTLAKGDGRGTAGLAWDLRVASGPPPFASSSSGGSPPMAGCSWAWGVETTLMAKGVTVKQALDMAQASGSGFMSDVAMVLGVGQASPSSTTPAPVDVLPSQPLPMPWSPAMDEELLELARLVCEALARDNKEARAEAKDARKAAAKGREHLGLAGADRRTSGVDRALAESAGEDAGSVSDAGDSVRPRGSTSRARARSAAGRTGDTSAHLSPGETVARLLAVPALASGSEGGAHAGEEEGRESPDGDEGGEHTNVDASGRDSVTGRPSGISMPSKVHWTPSNLPLEYLCIPTEQVALQFPRLARVPVHILRFRFALLRALNGHLRLALPCIGLVAGGAARQREGPGLPGGFTARLRTLVGTVFPDLKHELLNAALQASRIRGSARHAVPSGSLLLNNYKSLAGIAAGHTTILTSENIFAQAFEQIGSKASPFWRHVSNEGQAKAFDVTFHDDRGVDAGGVYREGLARILEDVQSDSIDLLIPCPNAKAGHRLGTHAWVPNPDLLNPDLLGPGAPPASVTRATGMLEFLGRLLGLSLRTKAGLGFSFPPAVWRGVAGGAPCVEDLMAHHAGLAGLLAALREWSPRGAAAEGMEGAAEAVGDATAASGAAPSSPRPTSVSPEEEQALFGETFPGLSWTVPSVTGRDTVLRRSTAKDGNGAAPVLARDRLAYAAAAESFALAELAPCISALRRGLGNVVPLKAISLLSPMELEVAVCGSPDVDVAVLRAHTTYDSPYSAKHPVVQRFWRVLETLTPEERSLYVRFAWGRARLPPPNTEWTSPHKISRLSGGDASLPMAHTCFFAIDLPEYSSDDKMRWGLTTACACAVGGILSG